MDNVEQIFLEKLQSSQLPVTLFLTRNVKLQGVIRGIDDKSILLSHDGRLQLIYKHAISTLSVGNALKEEDIVR